MNQSIVQDLHDKKGLPIELIHIILQYTYRPQQTSILEDVKNYSGSLLEIKHQYYEYWFQIEPGEHLNWLENDIIRYANNDKLTNLGPDNKMLNILDRSFFVLFLPFFSIKYFNKLLLFIEYVNILILWHSVVEMDFTDQIQNPCLWVFNYPIHDLV